jgi:hypothetical protein
MNVKFVMQLDQGIQFILFISDKEMVSKHHGNSAYSREPLHSVLGGQFLLARGLQVLLPELRNLKPAGHGPGDTGRLLYPGLHFE